MTPALRSGVSGHARIALAILATIASLVSVLAARTTAASASTGPILGDTAVESYTETAPSGAPEAFRATAQGTDSVQTVTVYVDATSTATQLIAGVYNDNSGHPGNLLAQGTLASPAAGTWVNVTVGPAAPITAGQAYWIALLTPSGSGTLAVRDRCCGVGQPSETSSGATTLPASWTTQATANNGPVSAYASNQPLAPPTPDQIGQWGSVTPWPMVAVHSTVLPNGKVLSWDAWETPSLAKVFDPATGTFADVTNPSGLFCAGQVVLGDGRVMVAGGFQVADTGIPDTNIFDSTTNTWTRAANMVDARWYPSLTALGDGRVIAISGNIDPTHWAENPEIYDPGTNTWTLLSGISTPMIHEAQYPLSTLTPRGKIFVIAADTGQGLLMDVNAQTLTSVGYSPVRNGSSAVYLPGKILYTGGGDTSSASNPSDMTATVIDTSGPHPIWRLTQPMNYGRYFHTLVDLPDGNVLAVGGSSTMTPYANGELPAEEWNPNTGAWTVLASMDVPRIYHSTAVLMPDGRVLVAGSGHEAPGQPGQYSAQYFSPPYLFKGPRPTITSAPPATSYGTSINVQTPDAASITSVALVGTGADTHTQDMNQRYVPLSFTAGSGSLTVQTPANAMTAPPGEYMLFVTVNGVPSVASIIQIDSAPSAPTNVVASAGDGVASVTWNAPPNGGAPISQYVVTPYAGTTPLTPINVSGTPPATRATLNGITDGTSYSFTVSATNQVGTGPVSTASNAVVPTSSAAAPGPPSTVTATSNLSTTTVNWTAPPANGSPIAQYVVTPYVGQSPQTPIAISGAPPPTTVNVSGLTQGTSYTFTVTAYNGLGPGSPSSPSNALTDTNCSCSIFGPSPLGAVGSGDDSSVELGVKFTSDVNGYVTGIRFYKQANNLGTHVGSLWSTAGMRLGSATFTNETAAGWQQVNFSAPVPVTAGTTYIASYFAPDGNYSTATSGFGSAVDNAPLHALANGTSPNGVFAYGPASSFPTGSSNGTNYLVDVSFSISGPPPTAPSAPTGVSATAGNAQATVTWNAPADGGSPISSYTIIPYVGPTPQAATTVTGSPPPLTATVVGLTNGTAYTFTVTATNAFGNGPESVPSFAVTPNSGQPNCPCTIFGSSTPTQVDGGATNPTEVGVKFTSETNGFVTGIRFYKTTSNIGTHIGNLWSIGGSLLGTANFANETASGWQQVTFDTPVAVTAGTTYVASYFAPAGHYSITPRGFSSAGVDNPPLHALADATSPNGVFADSPSSTFPASSFHATNYWVDLLFYITQPPPTAPGPPAGVSAAPGNGQALVTWTAPSSHGSPITSYTVTPFIGSTAQTAVAVTGSPPATRATVTGLTNGTSYTFAVTATNSVGPGPASSLSNSVTPSVSAPESIFGLSTPDRADGGDPGAVELGVKFTSDTNGFVTGIRFYKATANTGTHIGNLWTTAGNLLGTAAFTNETASGWQQVSFTRPVAVTAGTIYVASYYAPAGHYASTPSGFASAVDSPPLHALADSTTSNGVYGYGSTSNFPTSSFQATNYWVDVNFTSTAPATAPGAPTAVLAKWGNAQVLLSWTAPGDGGSPITSYTVTPYIGSAAQTAVTVTGSPPATSTTVTGLTNATGYTFTVSATNAVGSGPSSAPSNRVTPSATIFGPTVPTRAYSGHTAAAEVGVKFTSDANGYISGIRFYKAPTNTGTHIGNLWTVGGSLLGMATFANETASGWQKVNFATPVAITAATTYVASYYAPAGHYSATPFAFSNAGVDNPPLHAVANTASPNGVYTLGSTSGFPTRSYQATNYWVDVTYTTNGPPPTAPGAPIGVSASWGNAQAQVSWTAPGNGGSPITSYTVTPYSGTTAQTAVTVTGSPPITSTTVTGLTNATTYTFTVSATNAVGLGPPSVPSNPVTPNATIFGPSVPAKADSGRAAAGEVGVKFTSDTNGYITGIRFYKAAANTGTHIGNLWTIGGSPLATATFTNETTSGWQQVNFATPVAITAGTTYVASYYDPAGHYSATPFAFSTAGVDNPPLHALANTTSPNGVYITQSSSGFPDKSYQATNYWVDVTYSASGHTAPVDASVASAVAKPLTAATYTFYCGIGFRHGLPAGAGAGVFASTRYWAPDSFGSSLVAIPPCSGSDPATVVALAAWRPQIDERPYLT